MHEFPTKYDAPPLRPCREIKRFAGDTVWATGVLICAAAILALSAAVTLW